MGLVYSGILPYVRLGALDYDDLVQEASIGLMRACERWNPKQGALSTYAMFWIRQRCMRAMDKNRNRNSQHGALKRALQRAEMELAARSERADIETMAAHLDVPVRTLRNFYEADKRLVSTGADDYSLLDYIPDDTDVEAEAIRGAMTDTIHRALDQLPVQERQLIYGLYGMNGEPARSQAQMGRKLGLSHDEFDTYLAKVMKRVRALLKQHQ